MPIEKSSNCMDSGVDTRTQVRCKCQKGLVSAPEQPLRKDGAGVRN